MICFMYLKIQELGDAIVTSFVFLLLASFDNRDA